MFAILDSAVIPKNPDIRILRRPGRKPALRCEIIKIGDHRVLHISCLHTGGKCVKREAERQFHALRDFLLSEGIGCAVCLPGFRYSEQLYVSGFRPPDMRRHFLSRIPDVVAYVLDKTGFDPMRTCGVIYADRMTDSLLNTLPFLAERLRYPVLICKSGGEEACRLLSESGVPVMAALGSGFADCDRIYLCCGHPGRILRPPCRSVVLSACSGEIDAEGDTIIVDGAHFTVPGKILSAFPPGIDCDLLASALHRYLMLPERELPVCALTYREKIVL